MESFFEDAQRFCSNSSCVLHVQAGETSVIGSGNWAEVDGVMIGRGRYEGRMLCDRCGRALLSDRPH